MVWQSRDVTVIRWENPTAGNGRKPKPRGRRSYWTREAHMTRRAARKARKNAEGNEADKFCDMASDVREVGPKNYNQAKKCDQKDKWMVVVEEEL
uniref:Uncharacterized protein n=1 Tax=Peronospora matthiolae TaxID=2874970 RepID=A0AAV1UVF0_9STRA